MHISLMSLEPRDERAGVSSEVATIELSKIDFVVIQSNG
jgi:hypothetical protein